MKTETENFEDRFGSPEFEDRKGSNVQKATFQKEKLQMKKYGIKPTDTSIDKINKVIAEEEIDASPDKEDEDDLKEKKQENDHKNEIRIKMLQALNPRIVKTKELKNYVNRSEIKEEIYKTLNQYALEKLNAYKVAIGLNIPVELDESKGFMPTPRQVPAPPGGHPVPPGYERVKSWGGAYELRKTAQSLRDDHENLHIRRAMEKELQKSEDQETERQLNRAMEKEMIKTGIAEDTESLSEGKKENKEKKKQLIRKIGLQAMKKGKVDPSRGYIPQRAGREVLKGKIKLEETTNEETEQLDEANRNPNVMRQGRTKIIKARVRGGKVQRRKRVSAVKGYTLRGGKLKRMSAAERLRRKRGARRAKIKRKAKMARALMRRKRSMRRRASLGLKE